MTVVDFDMQVVKNYLTFCGIGITNAQLFELSVMEYRRNQVSILNLNFLHQDSVARHGNSVIHLIVIFQTF